jgi:hypothetical protein
MDVRARLQEVIENGAPGQAAHAEKLLIRVNAAHGEFSPGLLDEVGVLFDAYLNDPYLTRGPDDPSR